MPSSKKNGSTPPPPSHVVTQLRRGELIDFDALGRWYETDCPKWLRQTGLAPDVAALLASPDRNGKCLTDPTTWGHVQITGHAT